MANDTATPTIESLLRHAKTWIEEAEDAMKMHNDPSAETTTWFGQVNVDHKIRAKSFVHMAIDTLDKIESM